MRLAFVALKDCYDYNHFQVVTEISYLSGNPSSLYFQLVDLDQLDPKTGRPLRYVPPTGASVVVNFNYPLLTSIAYGAGDVGLYPGNIPIRPPGPQPCLQGTIPCQPGPFTRPAVQPFLAQDASIWSVPILPQDHIAYGSITATLTSGTLIFRLPSWSQIAFASTGEEGQFYT